MTVKIKVNVSTNRVGSQVEDEISVEIPEGLDENEIMEYKETAAREWMFENIEWGWMEVQ